MSTYDAQRNNNSDRVAQKYVDLDLFFGRKSSNSDVQDLTNIKAVKRSVRNLILTKSTTNLFKTKGITHRVPK